MPDDEGTLPSPVKIGYRDWLISAWGPHEASGAMRLGECRPLPGTIVIDTSVDRRQQAETMIHEIMHAMFSSFRLPDGFEDEESCVSAVAAAWATVLRDNPALLSFLAERLR